MNCINLEDFRQRAHAQLAPEIFDYFDGGAEDEVTLRDNRDAFNGITLWPRVLTGGPAATGPDALETELLGSKISMPVFLSPTAFHKLAHPDGELATARAARDAGTLMTVSMASTLPVEQLVGGIVGQGDAPMPWFQLYVQPDRGWTAELIARAEAAGCSALVITVDSPMFGRHERDLRNGFVDLPAGLHCAHMRTGDGGALRRIEFDATLSWSDIDWLRSVSRLPLVIKGITHPDDARLALEHGASAVFVSNHGGRQLDTVAASITLLPAIVSAVDGAVPVLMDGGIRRGTHVLKALALGATAVGIGRPVLWGLAADGQAGVRRVLALLRDELLQSLTLCGCHSLADLDPRLLYRIPAWQTWA